MQKKKKQKQKQNKNKTKTKTKRKGKKKLAFMILASNKTVPIPEVDFWNLAHSITVFSICSY